MTRTAHVLVPYKADVTPEDVLTERARRQLQKHALAAGYTLTTEPVRLDDVTEHGIPCAHYTADAEPITDQQPDGYLDRRPA